MIRYVDKLAVMRCLTLLAVDDTVAELSAALDRLGLTHNTYFIYSSDHGYNLGHHRLPDNKFNSYLHDLRIPLVVRGPGIKPGTVLHEIVTQVDLAPTWLGLAGLPTPTNYDRRSLVPLLISSDAVEGTQSVVPASVAAHWRQAVGHVGGAGGAAAAVAWRDHGLTAWYNCGFSMLNHSEDDASNTFIGLLVNSSRYGRWKYAEFDPTGKQTDFADVNFYELFDLDADPHETRNVYYNSSSSSEGGRELQGGSVVQPVTAALKQYLHETLRSFYTCSGAACP